MKKYLLILYINDMLNFKILKLLHILSIRVSLLIKYNKTITKNTNNFKNMRSIFILPYETI